LISAILWVVAIYVLSVLSPHHHITQQAVHPDDALLRLVAAEHAAKPTQRLLGLAHHVAAALTAERTV